MRWRWLNSAASFIFLGTLPIVQLEAAGGYRFIAPDPAKPWPQNLRLEWERWSLSQTTKTALLSDWEATMGSLPPDQADVLASLAIYWHQGPLLLVYSSSMQTLRFCENDTRVKSILYFARDQGYLNITAREYMWPWSERHVWCIGLREAWNIAVWY